MAKKFKNYDFSGIPIDQLISKPLLSIANAQTQMAEAQAHSIIENCFRKGRDGNYEPVLIKMSMTRSVVQTVEGQKPRMNPVKTYFLVPLISIIPFSSLGIDTVHIDFDLEVVAHFSKTDDDENDPYHQAHPSQNTPPKVDMIGKVTKKSHSQENNDAHTSYSINIVASPVPLTLGLRNMIDLYTKSIEPVEMHERHDTTTGRY